MKQNYANSIVLPNSTVLPDLDSLRCFVAAAEHLNFRRAAEVVFLSPAAFGERVRQLEDQLSMPLFVRTTRKVSLTRAGQRLLPQARIVLEEARRCHGIVGAAHAPFRVKLGTRYELGMSWLIPSLARLEKERPERHIDLAFGDSSELLAKITAERVDALVSSVRLNTAGFDYERLHEEQYVFVGSPKLIKSRPMSKPEHAKHHVLIDTLEDLPLFRYLLDAAGAESVWSFQRFQFLGTIGAIRRRLLEGAGVAVLPRYFVKADLRAKRLVVLMRKLELQSDHFRLIWRRGHALQDELRSLAGSLRKIPLR